MGPFVVLSPRSGKGQFVAQGFLFGKLLQQLLTKIWTTSRYFFHKIKILYSYNPQALEISSYALVDPFKLNVSFVSVPLLETPFTVMFDPLFIPSVRLESAPASAAHAISFWVKSV